MKHFELKKENNILKSNLIRIRSFRLKITITRKYKKKHSEVQIFPNTHTAHTVTQLLQMAL